MKIDYWLPDSEERNHKLSDIPSPTDMAKAIERVRELHKPFGPNNEWCDHCEIGQNSGYEWADYPCPTIQVLDGNNK